MTTTPPPRQARTDDASSVALVTGASRGVGRGIALGLGEQGWTVHVTGRGPTDPDSPLGATAAAVTGRGGRGIPIACDHHDDAAITALVDRIAGDRLDLLVNNVWAGPPVDPNAPARFWERPLSDWDSLVGLGLRAHWVASVAAVGHMVDQGRGMVVNISSAGAVDHLHSVAYGIAKAGLDKMTHDMAHELTDHDVTVISLWPGLVRTQQLLASGRSHIAGVPVADGEEPELQGRVVAAIAADVDRHRLSGTAVVTALAASHYGLVDRPLANPCDLFHEPMHPAMLG